MLPIVASAANSSLEAWDRRTQMGPSGPGMGANFKRLGPQRQLFADWTDGIAKGNIPKGVPPRPKGVERNLVITLWDWGTPTDGRTDSSGTDVRNPHLNANGPVYGAVQTTDILAVLDPIHNRTTTIKVPSTRPTLDARTPASPYWGTDGIWSRSADPRSVALDAQGRVWVTGQFRRPQEQPAFCQSAPNKFGQYFPLATSGRQVITYDPKTKEFTEINTCFTADHNQIGPDNAIYFGMNNAIGWIDIPQFDKTKNAEASQGWCPAVLDTNGDGKITEWTEPKEAVDPKKDHRIEFGCYSIAVNAKDNSAWCSGIGAEDRRLVRFERGSNPPQTCKTEVYEPPPGGSPPVYGSGGVEVDSQGVAWQNWRGSGHLTAFDRRKCKVTNGPNATGQSCPEGWTIYRKDQPTFQNPSPPINSGESYLMHLDAHDVLGLGKDLPVYGEVNTDSFEALIPGTRQFVTLRVPYPLGFFPRSANGRIDDPKAGWKGKGLWSNFSSYAAWHVEGGKGVKQKAVKFQMRPSPLAK
jgi:hypothetical protein